VHSFIGFDSISSTYVCHAAGKSKRVSGQMTDQLTYFNLRCPVLFCFSRENWCHYIRCINVVFGLPTNRPQGVVRLSNSVTSRLSLSLSLCCIATFSSLESPRLLARTYDAMSSVCLSACVSCQGQMLLDSFGKQNTFLFWAAAARTRDHQVMANAISRAERGLYSLARWVGGREGGSM
jgi:hypothetical protein